MILAERTVWPYRYRRGASALVVSMPHVGTFIPYSVGRTLTEAAVRRPDTDWHLVRLYDFLEALDATVIAATHSRYVIDVNRPPGGENLYPGRDTPRLCPIDTFDREPLYAPDGEPSPEEVARRLEAVWKPYHRRIQREIERVRAEHGAVLLWDAHSIVSESPRLFEGRLADLNLGTAGGASCDPELSSLLVAVLERHRDFTHVLDGRFKGGYITRQYGRPGEGVHAVQLEMAMALYGDESCPYCFRIDLAHRVRPVLRELLEAGLGWIAARRPESTQSGGRAFSA